MRTMLSLMHPMLLAVSLPAPPTSSSRASSPLTPEPQASSPPAPSPSSSNTPAPKATAPVTIRLKRSPLLIAFFRAPVWLYRSGFGWLFGHRFLLLTHRGRKSGRTFHTVLEVVHYDAERHESIVASGWGTRADWYRNIQTHPPIEVHTGGLRYVPAFRVVPPEEHFAIMEDYLRHQPPFIRRAVRRLGFDIQGTEAERRAHAANILLLAFRPDPAVYVSLSPTALSASTAPPGPATGG